MGSREEGKFLRCMFRNGVDVSFPRKIRTIFVTQLVVTHCLQSHFSLIHLVYL